VFISHDVYFIRALANHVVHVNAGRLTHYPGGYQYYLDKTKATSAREALTAGSRANSAPAQKSSAPALDRKAQKRLEAEQRQARSKVKKEQQQAVHDLEKKIQKLEQRQAEITAELEKPETYQAGAKAMELNREFKHNADEIAELTPKWEAAAAKLEAAESA
jgi:ATP-binding cassette, subfamily F, member 3